MDETLDEILMVAIHDNLDKLEDELDSYTVKKCNGCACCGEGIY